MSFLISSANSNRFFLVSWCFLAGNQSYFLFPIGKFRYQEMCHSTLEPLLLVQIRLYLLKMLLLLLCKKIPKKLYLSIFRSINTKLFHISDWFATILKLANVDSVPQDIDGQDVSEAVFGDDPSPRKMVVNEFSQLTTLNKERIVSWCHPN